MPTLAVLLLNDVAKYSPDQPRDGHGRFGSGGNGSKNYQAKAEAARAVSRKANASRNPKDHARAAALHAQAARSAPSYMKTPHNLEAAAHDYLSVR